MHILQRSVAGTGYFLRQMPTQFVKMEQIISLFHATHYRTGNSLASAFASRLIWLRVE